VTLDPGRVEIEEPRPADRGPATDRSGADLLPHPGEVAFVHRDDTPQNGLFADETLLVANAAPRRRAEFTAVRVCAREALSRLGHPAVSILPGNQREPLWPAGVVGSMTHCEGYSAAAVARTGHVASLGIDAEPNAQLPEGVLPQVTVGVEERMLKRLAATDTAGIAWDRLLFSAKESVYKAWFPLARSWLDFSDCEVRIDADSGSFQGILRVSGPTVGRNPITCMSGRWAITPSRHIVTAVTVPA
jgi:4'-phosphopantetheinyl transferase EntD